jgi:uncharacterized membrane protein YedE/YeeE
VKNSLAALLSGLLFGVGLSISGMMNPAKVQNFLDVAGHWDPSLAFVMGAALAVSSAGQFLVHRLHAPVLAAEFSLPTRRELDLKLLLGAGLFGVGWGAAGFCPGPALANLAFARSEAVIFVLAMLVGIGLYRWGYLPILEQRSEICDSCE